MKPQKVLFDDLIQRVEHFHDTFQIQNNYEASLISQPQFNLRAKLMQEEVDEYLMACKNKDVVEIADALGDQLYILLGTILKHGLQDVISDVFFEIQKSNMSKADKEGKPVFREDGKILKGSNYFKPNIKKVLNLSNETKV